MPETLRVSEILEFVRKHFPHPLPTEELLTRFGLDAFARRQAGGLSGGERRRVAVALAFAGDPDVAFLDEPSASLDVEARNALWDSIRSFAERGRAIVLTTHDLVEAQALATRIVVLERGRVVANGPADAITGSSPILVRLRRQRLPPLRNAISIEPERDAIAIRTTDEAELLRELVALRAELHGIEIVRTGLEQLLQGRQP